eukprot:Tbor_TRINITY_DN5138_c0_g1::TRINITY_DN5138_c0_g1_i1::g.26039::m.26039/K00166/BCKDHA, bkdA1; 2-oxoisovalerate dehydrogenase E1 component alpha subunit
MRRSFLRLCTAAPTLADTLSSFEHVWNIKFDGKPITSEMNFHNTPEYKRATPMFSVMDLKGKVENPENDPNLTQETCERIMTTMVTNNMADHIMLEAQRQGRISFYMTCFGEEAQSVASAAAVKDADMIFMQYREAPALMYRGFTIPQMIAQCMGNKEDPFKGRQMPVHYGSLELNVQMVSSPLGTQIPHAAGAGYAYKLDGTDRISMCYFGEGAASEGDFHAGLNFAATVGSHTLFICRNNGFAISTPASNQYNGDGILPRGIAYGMPSIRVDGNDVLAVYSAVKRAREIIKNDDTPVLIETMSYRVSHHSTSDDSTAYRPKEEVTGFDIFSPIRRFGMYLETKGWWSEDRTKALQKDTLKILQTELKRQESVDIWPVSSLFDDTYKELTPTLRAQRDETISHYERNKELYSKKH